MNFKEIKEAVDNDLTIDPSDLTGESIRTPILHNKYLREYYGAKDQKKRMEIEVDSLNKRLWLYYSGKADPKVYLKRSLDLKVMKGDVKMFIDTDSEMVEKTYKLSQLTDKVSFLKRILEEINRRTFHLSNANKSNSFQNGDF